MQALRTTEARRAFTGEATNGVLALPTVFAEDFAVEPSTLVDVGFTHGSTEALRARTCKRACNVLTFRTVFTDICGTLVDVGATCASSESRRTDAAEASNSVQTCCLVVTATITTGRIALVNVRFTMFTCEASDTTTTVTMSIVVRAASTILADFRMNAALVDVGIALGTCASGFAFTDEATVRVVASLAVRNPV